MKTENQSNERMFRLRQAVSKFSTGMLTHCDYAGRLVSRPMSPVKMDSLGSFWFYSDKRTTKLEDLRIVNLVFLDSSQGEYVSISGYGRLWKPLMKSKWSIWSDPRNLVMLEIVPESASYWDGPESKMTQLLNIPTTRFSPSGAASIPINPAGHATAPQS